MKLSDPQREEIRDRARAGENVAALAAEFGISIAWVYAIRGHVTGARGFKGMSPERRRDVARLGGIAVQATGKGHRFNAEEAGTAGRKGGEKVSSDRSHMAEIGRIGGKKSRRGRK